MRYFNYTPTVYDNMEISIDTRQEFSNGNFNFPKYRLISGFQIYKSGYKYIYISLRVFLNLKLRISIKSSTLSRGGRFSNTSNK